MHKTADNNEIFYLKILYLFVTSRPFEFRYAVFDRSKTLHMVRASARPSVANARRSSIELHGKNVARTCRQARIIQIHLEFCVP